MTKMKIYSISERPCSLVYDYYDKYELIVCHKFPEVNSKIDELSYYITINDERRSLNGETHCEYDRTLFDKPKLIKTDKNNDLYISTYEIDLSDYKITKNSSDEVNFNLVLPFDHIWNITELNMFIEN